MAQRTGGLEKVERLRRAFFNIVLVCAICSIVYLFVVNVLYGLSTFLGAEHPSLSQGLRMAVGVIVLAWAVSLVYAVDALKIIDEALRHCTEQGGEKMTKLEKIEKYIATVTKIGNLCLLALVFGSIFMMLLLAARVVWNIPAPIVLIYSSIFLFAVLACIALFLIETFLVIKKASIIGKITRQDIFTIVLNVFFILFLSLATPLFFMVFRLGW